MRLGISQAFVRKFSQAIQCAPGIIICVSEPLEAIAQTEINATGLALAVFNYV